MGRSQESFNKKEVKNKKDKKRKEKEQKRLDRRDSEKSGNFEDMIAYVDENGMLSSTPPDPTKKKVINSEDIEVSIPKQEDVELDPIRKGTVTFFNDSKGYGFIRDTETQESIFVHVNNLLEPIREGNTVTFEVEKGMKGLTAVRVTQFKNKPASDIAPWIGSLLMVLPSASMFIKDMKTGKTFCFRKRQ